MKKKLIAIGSTLGVLVIGGIILGSSYNSMNGLEKDVEASWANVETQYQRRAELLPNVQAIVEEAAAHEKGIIEALANARSAVQSAKTPSDLQEADALVSQAVKSINIMVENNPELKANGQFTAFIDEVSGTENRISTERTRYNEVTNTYNKKVTNFPGVMMAGIFGFDEKELFKATAGSETAPKIEFGDK